MPEFIDNLMQSIFGRFIRGYINTVNIFSVPSLVY